MGQVPDFYLIGAPKCGTTSLYLAMRQHPGLFVSREKEPSYFLTGDRPPTFVGPGDADMAKRYTWRRSDYEALYDAAPRDAVCGDCTVHYLGHLPALRRIQQLRPDARLIAVLRDPVDRAWSNWAALWPDRETDPDFLRACRAESQRLAAGWFPYWGYVTSGRYGQSLQNVFRHFAREQVLVLLFDDLIVQPREALRQLSGFLGVPDFPATVELPHINRSHLVPTDRLTRLEWFVRRRTFLSRRRRGPLHRWLSIDRRRARASMGPPPEVRRELLPCFADDIRLTHELTGLPVLHWLEA